MEHVNTVVKLLHEIKPYLRAKENEVLFKKVITRFLQDEGYGETKTKDVLNELLQKMDTNEVTLGCVKNHRLK
ncbi:hypothetical protein COL82_19205 [Bacillus toyonensis]|uniref:hypothetical protein n=1 Tax=Bacillus toyonensis TaxID=155322 RepID=UPI000BF50A88|nr:hypothetical protein [Bacillus toyonensis]PFZ75902.1 hypothetical protein COL82_19205 [Bacillus toyonensis]